MKKYIAIPLVALSLATPAMAAITQIYVNGSTATRTDVYYALAKKLAGSVDYAVKGAHGDNYFTFRGDWPADGSALAGQEVEIYYSANGSAAGIGHIVAADNVSFIDLTGASFNHAATVAFSDVFQDSTTYNGDVQETAIGVITFTFARSVNAPATLVNVTDQNFASLWSFGSCSLDLFTGLPADVGTTVYCTGRDDGSGTRITTLAETGYGIGNGVQQNYNAVGFVQNADQSKTRGANGAVWKAFGIADPDGEFLGDGWSSGGSVKADLQNAGVPLAAGAGIGYVGLNDTPGGGLQIEYNGYLFSPANVQQGNYTLWGYEHCDVTGGNAAANNFQSAFPAAFDNLLTGAPYTAAAPADGGTYTPGAATLSLNSMDCFRNDDGAHVFHN